MELLLGFLALSVLRLVACGPCGITAITRAPVCLDSYSSPGNHTFHSACSGDGFGCGLVHSSQLPLCWGEGTASRVPDHLVSMSFSELTCGSFHACGVQANNSQIHCWGDVQSPLSYMRMRSVTSGEHFSCALSALTGKVECWGLTDELGPVPEEKFKQISAGRHYVCGILDPSSRVKCWGGNDHGQCNSPMDVTFSTLVAGAQHACGLRDDNREAVCWGDKEFQLEAPVNTAMTALLLGDQQTCGVTLNAELVCWGGEKKPESPDEKLMRSVCTSNCQAHEFETDSNECEGLDEKLCLPCTRCREGTYESSPCIGKNDRKCLNCSWCASWEQEDHYCRTVCAQLQHPVSASRFKEIGKTIIRLFNDVLDVLKKEATMGAGFLLTLIHFNVLRGRFFYAVFLILSTACWFGWGIYSTVDKLYVIGYTIATCYQLTYGMMYFLFWNKDINTKVYLIQGVWSLSAVVILGGMSYMRTRALTVGTIASFMSMAFGLLVTIYHLVLDKREISDGEKYTAGILFFGVCCIWGWVVPSVNTVQTTGRWLAWLFGFTVGAYSIYLVYLTVRARREAEAAEAQRNSEAAEGEAQMMTEMQRRRGEAQRRNTSELTMPLLETEDMQQWA